MSPLHPFMALKLQSCYKEHVCVAASLCVKTVVFLLFFNLLADYIIDL